MNAYKRFFTLIVCLASTYVWASSSIDLAAGKKRVAIDSNSTEWSHFCFDQPYGCARFRVKEINHLTFGLIKILSSETVIPNFKNYCEKIFDDSKKTQNSLQGFSHSKKNSTESCSWSSGEQLTSFMWKDGILMMVTISDHKLRNSIIEMIEKARIYDQP
jgi:hypothetical protein